MPTGVLGEQVLGLTEPWQACMHGLIIVKGSLVPRPHPAFRRLQYEKRQATESWVGPGYKTS